MRQQHDFQGASTLKQGQLHEYLNANTEDPTQNQGSPPVNSDIRGNFKTTDSIISRTMKMQEHNSAATTKTAMYLLNKQAANGGQVVQAQPEFFRNNKQSSLLRQNKNSFQGTRLQMQQINLQSKATSHEPTSNQLMNSPSNKMFMYNEYLQKQQELSKKLQSPLVGPQ